MSKAKIILNRDHTISKTKLSMSSYLKTTSLNDASYVMLPIIPYGTEKSCIYMCVDAIRLEELTFDSGSIIYHSVIRSNIDEIPNRLNTEPDITYDYGNECIDVSSAEELYNALHYVFALGFVKELYCLSAADLDNMHFVEVTDVDIELKKGKSVVDHFHLENHVSGADVPFDVYSIDHMIRSLIDHYGVRGEGGSARIIPKIVLSKTPEGIRWRDQIGPVDLVLRDYSVFVPGTATGSYMHMQNQRMDVTASIHSATVYVYTYGFSPNRKITIDDLTPTAKFGMPRYIYGSTDSEEVDRVITASRNLEDYYTGDWIESESFEIYDYDTVLTIIEYAWIILSVFRENGRHVLAENNHRPITDFLLNVITVIEIMIDIRLQDIPSDDVLMITTDSNQPTQPRIRDACDILLQHDKREI